MGYNSISMSDTKRDRKNRSNLSKVRSSLWTGYCNDKDQTYYRRKYCSPISQSVSHRASNSEIILHNRVEK